MLSLAMACRRRGAPVRLCRPAPQVEKKEPITITHGDGQANVPITKFPWTPSPNLKEMGKDCLSFEKPGFLLCYLLLIIIIFRVVSANLWLTYLSLRTTPSMQAPNRTTLDMSKQLWIRKENIFHRQGVMFLKLWIFDICLAAIARLDYENHKPLHLKMHLMIW